MARGHFKNNNGRRPSVSMEPLLPSNDNTHIVNIEINTNTMVPSVLCKLPKHSGLGRSELEELSRKLAVATVANR